LDLFLDIDGVLCLGSLMYALPGQKKFHQPALEQLLWVINQDKNVVLVLSSSWRLKKKDVANANQNLESVGIPKIEYSTPEIGVNNRAEEVKAWLAQNPFGKIEKWVVIDDSSSKFSSDHIDVKNHLILVDPVKGFTEHDAKKAHKILQTVFKVE